MKFNRILSLTSPYMRGNDVKEAQKAMNNFGAWAGKVDGVFGPTTAAAAKQAKWMLGYPERQCTQTYGQALHDYLTRKKKPNALMQRRSNNRKVSHKPMREKALAESIKWIGTKESPPNTNRVMFSDWYGLRGPWCAMFVTWCYIQAGSKAFDPKKARWAYCPFMVNDARAQRNGLIVVPRDKVQPGDIAMFDWKGNGISDHTGIVESKPTTKGDFRCIEGNTSVSSNDNGGSVMRRNRNTRNVQVFIRVVE
jgi:hypothetical protein